MKGCTVRARFHPLLGVPLLMSVIACSGGGGSAPTPSGPAGGPQGPPIAIASPTPSPTPTPTLPPPVLTQGRVVDLPYDGTPTNPGVSVVNDSPAPTGAAIANASVYIGPRPVGGSTTPVGVPAGFQAALTDANGVFTFANAPLGRSVITIFGSAGYLAILHQDATIAATSSSLPTYYLSKPTLSENGFLALINADRVKYSVKPLVLDEALMEAGRYWAQFMAKNQYFAHCIPASLCTPGSTTPNPAAYTPHDLTPTARATYFHEYSQIGNGENLAAGFTDYTSAEAAFMSESQYCPNGNPVGCAFTEQNGHFINITNPGYAFGGVGMAIDPVMNYPYYDEEFGALYSGGLATYLQYVPGLRK